ncbi:MAG: LamG domain-containing protein [Bacteroidales bacterium]|jgi:hypothetical protein|nr:LamG domain-containing protein [Bacteroidales bacterium]
MKNFFVTLCFIIANIIVFAAPGDTVFVKTFTFSDINARRNTFYFPTGTQTWEKILMYYTIKCDAATTADSYPCGEWDYTTYTNVYKHTGVLDSTQYTHPKYTVNNTNFETLSGNSNPKYHFFEKVFEKTNYSYSNLNTTNVLNANININSGINPQNKDYKIYMLYSADLLSASGLTAGEITELDLATTSGTETLEFPCKLKISTTNLTSLSNQNVSQLTFTTVFDGYLFYDETTGKLHFSFTTPFIYNGTSSLVIELSSYENIHAINFSGEENIENTFLFTQESDNYLGIENLTYIPVPKEAFAPIMNEISISLWLYGDPILQPQNDWLFEGVDADNQRQISSHFPWSDSHVCWDAGNDGSGYDRIEKAAVTDEYEGKWNHVVFTKNATTGSMKVYLNGVLWHSGTGKYKPVQNISKFVIGSSASLNQNDCYDGYIDDFCIWDKELSLSEIQQIIYDRPQSSNPNLLVYYDFDEDLSADQHIIDKSDNNFDTELWGTLRRKSYKNVGRFKNFEIGNSLQQLTFYSGDYTPTTETVNYTTQELLNPYLLREFYLADTYTVLTANTFLYYPEYELTTHANLTIDTT